MNQRKKFIEACESEEESFARICGRFSIATKTGYKWLERFNEQGEAGLADRPRVARVLPHRTDDTRIDALLSLRKEHPTSGRKKLWGR